MKTNDIDKTNFLKLKYLIAVVVSLSAATTEAKEVTQHYKEWVLNANLELAANKKISDEVILITHGGLAHWGMEFITALQNQLKERGYSSLAINLSLAINNRHGMYDCQTTHRHRQTDAIDEIDVWVNWLQQQGNQRVILLGHSRGGLQTALYATERDNDAVKAIILLAPATRDNASAADYQQRHNKALAPLLLKAQQLVDADKGDTVLDHAAIMQCRDTGVSANAFISYYAVDPRLDTPFLIPKLHKPTLVVIAGDDEVVVGLEQKIAPLVDAANVQMQVIEGAGHLFRDFNTDEAVEAMVAFLQGIK